MNDELDVLSDEGASLDVTPLPMVALSSPWRAFTTARM